MQTDVTIQDLYDYQHLRSEIRSFKEMISSLYDTSHAIPIGSVSHGTQPSDPTAAAAFRIMALQEQLKEKEAQLAERVQVIEAWVEQLPDPEIRSIVRMHFISGLTWNQTAQRIYHNATGDGVRKYFKRWARQYEAERNGYDPDP